ncbi:hypothetical protein EWB00_001819 [Schistosoma japonicum]|uniref:Uncharacterized protein n=1 Tax=Schistosoma japonicum TaxID=6182 RepID=A0A4Z2DEC2_SCHJA|nr:hypothetical protein EWB00_001819 [Schistosoma japonicum]
MDPAYLDSYYFETDKEEYNDIPTGVDISRDYNQASNVSSDSLIKMRAQWTGELKQVEDEIQTLRQVLLSKFRRQQFLKRQLGITPIEELKSEVKQGLVTLRTSDAYLKTSAIVKTAKDKTSAALFEKWNLLRQTNAYKSLEDKVGSACSNVYMSIPFSNMGISTGSSLLGKLSRTRTSTGDEQSGNSQSVVCTATTAIKSCNSGANNNEALHSIPVASSNITKNQNTNNYSEGDVEIDADDSIQSENLLNDEVVLLSNRTDNRK